MLTVYDPVRNAVYDAYHIRVRGVELYKDVHGPTLIEEKKL